jgi:hypothetical protein
VGRIPQTKRRRAALDEMHERGNRFPEFWKFISGGNPNHSEGTTDHTDVTEKSGTETNPSKGCVETEIIGFSFQVFD